MTEDGPAYRHYAKDWLEGTAHMSLETQGAYQRLLDHQWERGRLPADASGLMRLLGVTPARFRQLWAVLEPHFPGAPPANARLEAERIKAKRWREQRVMAGKEGGVARWRGDSDRQATAKRPLSESHSEVDGEMIARAGASVSVSVQDKPPPPRAREEPDPAREAIPEPYREAYDGFVRAARRPEAVRASIAALGPGGMHAANGVTWEHVGHALLDAAAMDGGPFSAAHVAGCIRRLIAGPGRPTGGTPAEPTLAEKLRALNLTERSP